MILPPSLQPYRLLAEAVLVLAVIGVGSGWWLEHNHKEQKIGAEKVQAADNSAVQVQEKHDAKADTDALAGLQQQNVALADWIAHHPVQPLIVRRGPSCGTQGGTVVGSDTAGNVPAGDGSGVQRPDSIDIGPRLRLLSEVAERAAEYATACQVDVSKRAAH